MLFSQKQDFRAEGGMRTDRQAEETKSLAQQIESEAKERSAWAYCIVEEA
jgi:hypothetical protein